MASGQRYAGSGVYERELRSFEEAHRRILCFGLLMKRSVAPLCAVGRTAALLAAIRSVLLVRGQGRCVPCSRALSCVVSGPGSAQRGPEEDKLNAALISNALEPAFEMRTASAGRVSSSLWAAPAAKKPGS